MIKPYQEKSSSKKEQVRDMFDSIARRYDFLNHLLSFGIDRRWRKKAIKLLLNKYQKPIIIDIACGTGDFSISALRLHPEKVYGVDLSSEMIEVGEKKVAKKGLSNSISFQQGDSENLEFEDGFCDLIMAAFGVRNFENLEKGLSEMNRVLKPGGTCLVLEFSKPLSFPFKQIYRFYFRFILPVIGRMISKDKTAYTYLPESVNAFPEGNDFLNILAKCGFSQIQVKRLTFGIASIYIGVKK